MEQDERFMREALREAAAARDDDEIPVGAVVVWKGRAGLANVANLTQSAMREAMQECRRLGKVLAAHCEVDALLRGGELLWADHNRREQLHDPTAHAEMIALTAATEAVGGKYLNECTLYVTLEPCPMCAAALNWAQVGRIVYGAPDPRRGCTLYSPSLLHPRTEVVSGVLADDCASLMRDYFQSIRK